MIRFSSLASAAVLALLLMASSCQKTGENSGEQASGAGATGTLDLSFSLGEALTKANSDGYSNYPLGHDGSTNVYDVSFFVFNADGLREGYSRVMDRTGKDLSGYTIYDSSKDADYVGYCLAEIETSLKETSNSEGTLTTYTSDDYNNILFSFSGLTYGKKRVYCIVNASKGNAIYGGDSSLSQKQRLDACITEEEFLKTIVNIDGYNLSYNKETGLFDGFIMHIGKKDLFLTSSQKSEAVTTTPLATCVHLSSLSFARSEGTSSKSALGSATFYYMGSYLSNMVNACRIDGSPVEDLKTNPDRWTRKCGRVDEFYSEAEMSYKLYYGYEVAANFKNNIYESSVSERNYDYMYSTYPFWGTSEKWACTFSTDEYKTVNSSDFLKSRVETILENCGGDSKNPDYGWFPKRLTDDSFDFAFLPSDPDASMMSNFYCLANPTSTDAQGWEATFTPRKTRLVICLYQASKSNGNEQRIYYYPVTLPELELGQMYNLVVTITRFGSDDPDVMSWLNGGNFDLSMETWIEGNTIKVII